MEATELFDLFGEVGYCTICQDDLIEGERIRAINACQHMFHAKCLDEWFRRKLECPLCRVGIETLDPVIPVIPVATDIERNALTYAVVNGILKKFPTAIGFFSQRQSSRILIANLSIDGIRPLPIDTSNRSALNGLKTATLLVLSTRMNISRGGVYASATIRNWKERLAQLSEWAPIWQY